QYYVIHYYPFLFSSLIISILLITNSLSSSFSFFFFFNDPATTEIYTLSLHDALPISPAMQLARPLSRVVFPLLEPPEISRKTTRSEEHTSELQSLAYLVCRLLLEKKKKKKKKKNNTKKKKKCN